MCKGPGRSKKGEETSLTFFFFFFARARGRQVSGPDGEMVKGKQAKQGRWFHSGLIDGVKFSKLQNPPVASAVVAPAGVRALSGRLVGGARTAVSISQVLGNGNKRPTQ